MATACSQSKFPICTASFEVGCFRAHRQSEFPIWFGVFVCFKRWGKSAQSDFDFDYDYDYDFDYDWATEVKNYGNHPLVLQIKVYNCVYKKVYSNKF